MEWKPAEENVSSGRGATRTLDDFEVRDKWRLLKEHSRVHFHYTLTSAS
jgi:hypothetical protein